LTSDLVHSRPLTRLPAAQYIRMSTEHQKYSPENQLEAIAAYASLFSMDVVQTYSDLGKSGLKLANRPGLKALLDDVETRRNGFRVVLVFDVSRWGRFQDADESAYYEYVLKKAGVHVHYCAEHFTNDGSLSSALLKVLKRTMAGEYSRELSVKVFAGQKRQVELGFHQGGHAGYGLRRRLVDVDGNDKGILQLGEWKCLQSDKVILVPGPQLELDVVAGIYRSYINDGMTETEIRNDLNARGIETAYDRLWTLYDVHKVLSSPKYTGVNVFNRRSFKLGQKRVRNSPDLWIRCPDAFQAIVSSEDFQKAQTLIAARSRKWEADGMLDKLKALLKVSGRLTAKIMKLVFDPKLPVGGFAISQQLIGQAAVARKREEKLTVAIAATFTAEPLDEPLKFWTGELAIPAVMKFAAYHQVFQQLLDPYSLMRTNQSGFNVVLVRMEDWTRLDTVATSAKMQKITRSVEELIGALQSAGKQTGAPYTVCLCPASRALRGDGEWREFLVDMEAEVATRLGNAPGVYVITSTEIEDLYPVAEYEDEYADKLGHVPYTAEFFAALSTMIVRRISGLRGPEYKVVVLDCDETLWTGVCGEDHAMGVVVDPARRALQEPMLKQRDAGMLLCLCSKNNEEDVWEVFEQNPGMLLRREHIAGFRINWKSKSENLKALAEQLKLGLDSFVVVDDSPVECAEMESGCPEILVLQMPAESEQWPLFLKHVWAFDHVKATAEDKRRTGLYRENAEREQSRGESQSFDDFIASLELNVDIRPMEAEHLERTSQLTQRTNQFNCTTIRREESEILQTISAGAQCLIVNLRDRFGDYGLIGALIYEIKQESVVVDTMLLSCRALGRRVEHTMLARLAAIAREHELEWVDVRFAPTAKNLPPAEFLDEIEGAQKIEAAHGALYRISTQMPI
jgi:FkbH-like protein